MSRPLLLLGALALAASACTAASGADPSAAATTTAAPATTARATSTTAVTTTTTTTTVAPTTTEPLFDLTGTVVTPEGKPLGGAVVTASNGATSISDESGAFALSAVPGGPFTVTRPAWLATEVDFSGDDPLEVVLEPFIARALRVSKYVVAEPDEFAALVELAAGTAVNTLVFDVKDETGEVIYETDVEEAHAIGAVNPMYDPVAALAVARDAGFYTVARVVTFEDRIKAAADAEAKLAGWWVDPVDEANWEYPLALGVEACELGFDEIQFDYVRFPAGQTAAVAAARRPLDQDQRTAAIAAFLSHARATLHPLGCAVAADIFGIVLSSPTDEGIGQRPEELSHVVDVISPMLYPSHYSPGWIGFEDPNAHPGPVVGGALDDGYPRFEGSAIMRPWLQAFYYNGSQILTEIEVTEERGFGWMLWNAAGNYAESWLPERDDASIDS